MKSYRDKLNSNGLDDTDISKPWDKDNQAWWDWYVGLADNDDKKDPVIAAEPLPDVTIPTDDEVVSELSETYPLKNDQIIFFRKNGFIKLKKVFSPGAVLKLRTELIKLLKKEFDVNPDKEAHDRFLSLEMIWPKNKLLRIRIITTSWTNFCRSTWGVSS